MNKYQIAVDIMIAHVDKDMATVSQMISEATGLPLNQARGYYARAVREEHAPGEIKLMKRGRKPGSKLDRTKSDDGVNMGQFLDIMSDVHEQVQNDTLAAAA